MVVVVVGGYHAEEAVLGLELDVDAGADVVRGQRGNTNTQVTIHSILV